MLVSLAVACWLLIALPSTLLIYRYAYGGFLDTPIVLVSPETLTGAWRILGVGLIFVPFLYFLATLGLVAAYWSARGWLWGAGSFVVASVVFSRARSAAWKRAASEVYTRHLKEGTSPEEAADIARVVMETRRFWPPGSDRVGD